MAARSDAPANRPVPPDPSRPPSPRLSKAVEDRLESLLSDPIVQLLMERDGVERDVLLRMAANVRRRGLRGEHEDGDRRAPKPPRP